MTLQGGFLNAEQRTVYNTGTLHGGKFRTFHSVVIPASAAWPTANKAILMPFELAGPTTVRELFFQAGTTPGTTNYDLGIYSDQFVRLMSLGATAAVNTTDATLPVGGGAVGPYTLTRGRYYMAMASQAATLTTRASVNANAFMRALGMVMMLSAYPLPATITPATAVDNYFPMMGFTTDTAAIL